MQYNDADLELSIGSNRDSFCHSNDISNRVKETAWFTSCSRLFVKIVEIAVNTDDGTSTHVNVMSSTGTGNDCNCKKSSNATIAHSTIS